jgi:hypothetical protein
VLACILPHTDRRTVPTYRFFIGFRHDITREMVFVELVFLSHVRTWLRGVIEVSTCVVVPVVATTASGTARVSTRCRSCITFRVAVYLVSMMMMMKLGQ